MSPTQALTVFQLLGVTAADLATHVGLKAARNRLLMARHADHNGGTADDAASRVNAAYDVLKQLPEGWCECAPEAFEAPAGYVLPGAFYDRRKPEHGPPPWQTDPDCLANAIAQQTYKDLNYIKKLMWELSGRSTTEYRLYYFDGTLRGAITVFGSPDIHRDMAEAVLGWHGRTRGFGHRAVFVQTRREPALLLVYLDGRHLGRPVPFGHAHHDEDPCNDPVFVRALPARLSAVG